jgi:hypothetical protein
MKAIFTSRFVSKQQLYGPHLLIKALKFIADNKDVCAAVGYHHGKKGMA